MEGDVWGPGWHCLHGRCLVLIPIPMGAAAMEERVLCIPQLPPRLWWPGRSRCGAGKIHSGHYLQPLPVLREVVFLFFCSLSYLGKDRCFLQCIHYPELFGA